MDDTGLGSESAGRGEEELHQNTTTSSSGISNPNSVESPDGSTSTGRENNSCKNPTRQGPVVRSRSRSKLRAGYEEGNELFDDCKFAEAFKKFTLVYEGRKSSLGPDSPETLEAKNRMAMALDADEKYTEAFKLYSEVYQGRKRVLGEGKISPPFPSPNSHTIVIVLIQFWFCLSMKISILWWMDKF